MGAHPCRDLLFEPKRRWFVVHPIGHLGGSMLLGHPPSRIVVRVAIADAVAETRRALVVPVSQVDRDLTRRCDRASSRARHRPVAARFDFGAVARWTTACARFSCASGSPTNSTARAAASATRSDIGSAMPDVLRGQDHQPAGDESCVLARLEHPGQPVEPGVGVASRGST